MFGRTEVVTRQELYAMVWSSPMTEVATKFQMSDRGLAKLCERHNIPVPPRGWWAKKEAGQKVSFVPLRPAASAYAEKIPIQIRDDFREWLTLDERQDLERRVDHEQEAQIVVPTEVTKRHRLLRTTTTSPLKFNVSVSAAAKNRALRIAHAVLTACEQRGYTFEADPKRPSIAKMLVCGEAIGFHIEEQKEGFDHVLTPKEEREVKAGRGWSIPKRDFKRTGRLALVIDEYSGSERRTFADGAKQRLEDCLEEFMIALLRTAMAIRAMTNYWDDRRRSSEAEAERIAREKAKKEEEERRRREVLTAADDFMRTRAIRDLIREVRSRSNSQSVLDWIAFAETIAEDLDPVRHITHG